MLEIYLLLWFCARGERLEAAGRGNMQLRNAVLGSRKNSRFTIFISTPVSVSLRVLSDHGMNLHLFKLNLVVSIVLIFIRRSISHNSLAVEGRI